MSDELKKMTEEVPTLTLEPFAAAEAVQAAAQETLAAVEAVETVEEKAGEVQISEEVKQEGTLAEAKFTEEEKAQIESFAKQIDITNSNVILQYGAGAQQKLADFSEKALENVKTQDLGEVGDMLANVVAELKSFDAGEEDKKGGLFGLFKKQENKLEVLKAKYDKAEVNVDKIVEGLETHQIRLMKDTAMLEQMYDMNLTYFKELSMYIAAGKKKLEEVRNTELAELTKKAEESQLPEDAQAAKDLAAYCDRFEKKLYDLELSRMVSIQTAPQIRLIQDNNTMMVEKIQSTIVNTIPLWKNQMVIALGLHHAQEAAKAQNAVSDMTNDLLKKNAAALHEASVATAKESERGIIDMATLTETNKQLVDTLDEVLKIQTDGRQKRLQAEADMIKMENELKEKLLKMNR